MWGFCARTGILCNAWVLINISLLNLALELNVFKILNLYCRSLFLICSNLAKNVCVCFLFDISDQILFQTSNIIKYLIKLLWTC